MATLACGLGDLASQREVPTAEEKAEATAVPLAPMEEVVTADMERELIVVETVQVEKEGVVEGEVAVPAAPAAPQEEQTPDAMFFESYGVNPFIDTADDHLCTFALDVDTGSYTAARG